ncbi:type 1 fimbrial protein, partial [Escherichia coli]|nr:type 1 fimbrial protein [Escherichia coli]
DNVLHYTAVVKKSSAAGATVTEGAFSAVANFNLTYQ